MLRVENLNAWYHADKLILENVSFNLANNTVVGLLGSNGAGKTTLINCLSGIHNNILVKSLYFNGELEEFNNREFKKNRHVVFTEDEAFKYWNANEYINYLAYAYNVDIDKEYMHFMLDGFNFEKYINYTIDELSTGNKKKVYLISAFY